MVLNYVNVVFSIVFVLKYRKKDCLLHYENSTMNTII